jgi:hypothetical protein
VHEVCRIGDSSGAGHFCSRNQIIVHENIVTVSGNVENRQKKESRDNGSPFFGLEKVAKGLSY